MHRVVTPAVVGSSPAAPAKLFFVKFNICNYNKLLLTSQLEKKMNKQQLSEFCFMASLVSVLVSIATWVFVSPEDPAHGERFGIFIGLWAPTLMGLANYFKSQE